MTGERAMRTAGAAGMLLTAVIVGVSVLMRLSAQGAGTAAAVDDDVVTWARIAHRVAAMGVGVLAAYVLVAGMKASAAQRASGLVIVAVTAILALAGRYTPGYRIDAVTVINVVGGTVLGCAFWSLRSEPRADARAWPTAAIGLLIAAAATGAVIGAVPDAAFSAFHALLGLAGAVAIGVMAWRARSRPLALALAALIVIELGLGWAARGSVRASLALPWAHAMGSFALALLLVQAACATRPVSR